MRVTILSVAGLLLTNASFAGVLATDEEIRQAIVGNTVSGTEDGKSYTEYYRPDGYVHGEDAEDPMSESGA